MVDDNEGSGLIQGGVTHCGQTAGETKAPTDEVEASLWRRQMSLFQHLHFLR
jgi:hypothetical protein